MHTLLALTLSSGNMSLNTLLPLIIPLIILELILKIVALVDLLRREPGRVQGSKPIWVLIILLISTIGPICYLILGRKE